MPRLPDSVYERLAHPGYFMVTNPEKYPKCFPPFIPFVNTDELDPSIVDPFLELLQKYWETTSYYWEPGECDLTSVAIGELRALLIKSALPHSSKATLMIYPNLFDPKHQWINLLIPHQPPIAIDPVGVHHPVFHTVIPYFGPCQPCVLDGIYFAQSSNIYTHSSRMSLDNERRLAIIAKRFHE